MNKIYNDCHTPLTATLKRVMHSNLTRIKRLTKISNETYASIFILNAMEEEYAFQIQ